MSHRRPYACENDATAAQYNFLLVGENKGHVPVILYTSCVCQCSNTYTADMHTLPMQSVCGMSTHLAPCTSSSCITAYYTQMLCSMPHYCIACCSTVPVVHNCKVLVGQAVTCQVRYSKLRCVLLQVQMGFQDK